jgi:hypothetical protein
MNKLGVKELTEMLKMAMIEEKQESIRQNVAKIETRKNRLLFDIGNLNTASVNACGVSMRSELHFKQTYMTSICVHMIDCPIRKTCSTLHSLISKKGSRKNSGNRTVNSDNVKIEKDFSVKGSFSLEFNGNAYTITGYSNWTSFKKSLTETLPRKKALSLGMTTGQYSGLMHAGSMKKKLDI